MKVLADPWIVEKKQTHTHTHTAHHISPHHWWLQLLKSTGQLVQSSQVKVQHKTSLIPPPSNKVHLKPPLSSRAPLVDRAAVGKKHGATSNFPRDLSTTCRARRPIGQRSSEEGTISQTPSLGIQIPSQKVIGDTLMWVLRGSLGNDSSCFIHIR